MTQIRAQVVTQRANDLPRDWIVNTLHFNIGAVWTAIGNDTDWQAVANDVNNAFATLRQHIPPGYQVQTKVYDLEDPQPRLPIKTSALIPYAQASGGSQPREVALCLSFRGATNTKRTRGRIFLGPWATTVADERPPAGARANAIAIANALADIGGVDMDWCVRSQFPIEAGDQGGTMHSIQASWCDDEWDTIRSRGLRPTTRTTAAHSE